MNSREKDVIVVGGGFVGNYVAKQLATRSIDTLVIEEHKEIGVPRHCAGLISVSGLKRLNLHKIAREKGLILQQIQHAIFTSKNGIQRKITSDTTKTYVIDRPKLDKLVYRQAKTRGAKYLLNTRVLEIRENGHVHLRLNNGREKVFHAKVIIDAEGARRALIKSFPNIQPTPKLPGVQMDIRTRTTLLPQNTVEVIFNVPDFFSWIIPLDEKTYRFGVCTKEWSNRLRPLLLQLIHERVASYTKIREFGGLVITDGPIPQHVWGRILALGDAGGWVKPTTGGGVIFGGLTAKIAAEIIQEKLQHDSPLSDFETAVNPYEREFTMMQLARNILNMLGPNGIDRVLRLLPQTIVSQLEGEYDLQFKTLLKLAFPLLLLL